MTFRFSFIDEDLDKQYKKEERWNLMIQYATAFAIFIACTRRIWTGCISHYARRTKEIGIRKVLGASQSQILSLLSREFVLYIALSSLIAFPIAYYATNQWLQTFAYRTELGIGAFLLGSHSHVPRRTHNRHHPDPQSRTRKPGGCFAR